MSAIRCCCSCCHNTHMPGMFQPQLYQTFSNLFHVSIYPTILLSRAFQYFEQFLKEIAIVRLSLMDSMLILPLRSALNHRTGISLRSAEASATECSSLAGQTVNSFFSTEQGLQGRKCHGFCAIIAPHLKIRGAEIGSDLLCERAM
jgi:hypothetical protein